METLEPLIKAHPFFKGLEPQHLQLIVGCARNERHAEGEMLFREGEEANWFYVIREGRLALEVHIPGRGPVVLQTLGEGEVMGTSWLFPPYRWQFSARVLQPTRLLAFDGKCLRGKCEQDHDLGYELVKRAAQILMQRLDAARLQLWISMASAPEIIAPPASVADPMLPAPYRIRRLRTETPDTFTMHLEPVNGTSGFSFAPGQFNMLYVFGVGEVPISISSNPAKPHDLQHTTRAVGTVTRAMRKLKRGDVLAVRGPYGTQWPLDEAIGRDVVVVAGGLGLAPLRPALYRLMAQRQKYKRLVLLYGARSPEEILFPDELERWRGKFDFDVHVTVDRATPAWRGHVGVVTTFIPRAPFDPANTVALVCGPEVMMRFALMGLHHRGVAHDRTYVSMERNVKCAIGFCGHCQFGPTFICRDGPIFRFDRIESIFTMPEV